MWLTAIAVAVAAISLTCLLFVSNYYNYVAESTSIGSLLRIAEGKPYIGSLDEMPLFLNPFSPYLAWLLTPVLRTFRWTNPEPVALAGRLLVLAIFVLYVRQLRQFFRAEFPREFRDRFFLLAVLWFMLLFPANVVAIRPDLLSFLAEFVSFTLLYRFLFEPNSGKRLLLMAGAMSGAAVATKLNTVGGTAGMVLFMAMERDFRAIAMFLAAAVLSSGSLFLLDYACYGQAVLVNMVGSVHGETFAGMELARLALSLIDQLGIANLLLFVLTAAGIMAIRRGNPRKARLFTLFMAGSLVFATLGQAKIGAALNYHIGFFMLATIPLSIGLAQLFDPAAPEFPARPLRWGFCLLWTLLVAKATVLPIGILMNDRRHYPYADVKAMIAREFPTALIYTPDASTAVQFHERVMLGPWTEQILTLSKDLARDVPAIRSRMAAHPFILAVTTGSGCEKWKPDGLFKQETLHLDRLAARYDKICVFAAREKEH